MRKAQENHYSSMFRFLVVRIMLVSLGPLAAIGGANFLLFYHLNKSLVLEQHANFLRYHKTSVESFLQGLVAEVLSVANNYTLEELVSGGLERMYRMVQERGGLFEDLGIIDSMGNHVQYLGPYDLARKNYRETEWFRKVVEEGVYVSDMFLGFRGVPHFVIAVRRTVGDDFWILRATVNTDYLAKVLDAARLGTTGESFIVNERGLYQVPPRSGGMPLEDSNFPYLDFHPGIKVSEVTMGEKVFLCSSVWISRPKWLLVFKQESGDVFSPLWKASLLGVLLFLVGGLGSVILSVAAAREQVKRVYKADREKEALTQRLLLAGRTAAVGEMSAGLAHEINNPLATIDTLQTLIRDLASTSPISEEDRQEIMDSAAKIGQQVARCKVITQGLLKFSRMVDAPPEEVDLSQLLEELVTITKTRAKVENVALHLEMENLPKIWACAAHLQQIFANLINNALDAVAGREKPLVRVKARRQDDKVIVSVEDNGCGIPPQDIPRIFTPFFTTKPPGKGTGLGLAICHGLVQNMGGEIRVESAVGLGTRFTVLIPIQDARAQNGAKGLEGPNHTSPERVSPGRPVHGELQ
jgi:two-component system NtrC family sensor kinase